MCSENKFYKDRNTGANEGGTEKLTMAIMIPSIPFKYTPASGEDKFFYALKNLPGDSKDKKNDYYVFHSFKINRVKEETNALERHETDFLIFHPSKGILCIEHKNGKAMLKERDWFYASEKVEQDKCGNNRVFWKKGGPMHHGGPFRQAEERMNDLIDYISNQQIKSHGDPNKSLKAHCKALFAVCFPKIKAADEKYSVKENGEFINKVFEDNLNGAESPKELVIYGEDLDSPETLKEKIDSIFNYKSINSYAKVGENEGVIKTGYENGERLHDEDIQNLFDLVLCPNFNIVETVDSNTGETKYIRMNEDQIRVLDLLITKKEMAVSGMAGTGKTILALQLARKKVMKGENVLFLCRSSYQKKELEKQGSNSNIEFRDIDWLIESHNAAINAKVKRELNFYVVLNERIIDEKIEKGELKVSKKGKRPSFKVETIIVDEAQDFCKGKVFDSLKALYSDIKNISVFSAREKLLKQRFRERTAGIEKSFYIFYDEFQTEDDSKIIEFAQNIKNHIELEKNCRNTINTTISALNPMVDVGKNYCQRQERGEKVKIDFYEFKSDFCAKLDNILRNYSLFPQDTVILTFKSDSIRDPFFEENQRESVLLGFPNRLVNKDGTVLSIDKLTAEQKTDKYYKLDDKTLFFFTNWKNYQGLERRNIVLVDFEPEKLFGEENEIYSKHFYVCMTRAQEQVYILSENPDGNEELNKLMWLEDWLIQIETRKSWLDMDWYEDESGGLDCVDLDNIGKIEREKRNDPDFMKKLKSCIESNDNLRLEQQAKDCNVYASILKEYFRSTLEEESARNAYESEVEATNRSQARLNESLIREYLRFNNISKRMAFCAALGVESIYDYDVVIRNAFKELNILGKWAEKLGMPEGKFHEYIRALIGIWHKVFDEMGSLEYLEDISYGDFAKVEEFSKILDLDLMEYQDNGGDIAILWEGYQIAKEWRKRPGITVTEKFVDSDLLIQNCMPPSFWENFIILVNSCLDSYNEVVRNNDSKSPGYTGEITVLPDVIKWILTDKPNYVRIEHDKLKQLELLQQQAMDCYLKAILLMEKLDLDERRMEGQYTEELDLRVCAINSFTENYLDNIKLIRFEEGKNGI